MRSASAPGTGALREGLDFRSHAAGGSSDLGGSIGIPPPENSKTAQRILFAGDPQLSISYRRSLKPALAHRSTCEIGRPDEQEGP
jgi:hypothetical protein